MNASVAQGVRVEGRAFLVTARSDSLTTKLLAHSVEDHCRLSCTPLSHDAFFVTHVSDALIMVDVAGFSLVELEAFLRRTQETFPLGRVVLVNVDRADNGFHLFNWPIVKGVIFHQDSEVLVSKALKVVSTGRSWFPRSYMDYLVLQRKVPTPCGRVMESLTRRERQMVEHLAQGLSNHEIADALCLSTHTVKAHLQSLYRKVGVRNRVGVMRWVQDHHLEHSAMC